MSKKETPELPIVSERDKHINSRTSDCFGTGSTHQPLLNPNPLLPQPFHQW